jgi:hypothetical protein
MRLLINLLLSFSSIIYVSNTCAQSTGLIGGVGFSPMIFIENETDKANACGAIYDRDVKNVYNLSAFLHHEIPLSQSQSTYLRMGLNVHMGKYRVNGFGRSSYGNHEYDGAFVSYQLGMASLFIKRGKREGWKPYGGAGFYIKFDPSTIKTEGEYSYFRAVDSTSGVRNIDEFDVRSKIKANAGFQAVFGVEKELNRGALLFEIATRYGITKTWSKIDYYYHEMIIELKVGGHVKNYGE